MRLFDSLSERDDIYFFTQPLQKWEDIFPSGSKLFCTEEGVRWNQPLNLDMVKGTDNPSYAGLTWREFLNVGEKMHTNITLAESNPSYYFTAGPKSPEMNFITCDNKNYFIYFDGNHRTAIGKVLFSLKNMPSILDGVTIYNNIIDRDFYALYKEAINFIFSHRLLLHLQPHCEQIRRDEGVNWHNDIYRVYCTLRNCKTGEETDLDKDQLSILLQSIKDKKSKSWISRKFLLTSNLRILKGVL